MSVCEDVGEGEEVLEEDGGIAVIEDAVKVLLQGLGEDVNREGLKKTPLRVAKALCEGTRGLSLKSQDLTAIFLVARLACSFAMENDIHTVLDGATLISTLWIIYMMRFKLKSTYIKELDSMPLYYTVVPAVLLAVFVHPHTRHFILYRVLWAFCVYLESVSVLPQLRLMQNAKMVEPFTAHYVFALGVARFLGCAHWILRVIEYGPAYLLLAGNGYYFWYLWGPMVVIAEIVQTVILADFCYYYVKSVIDGQLLTRLPSMV